MPDDHHPSRDPRLDEPGDLGQPAPLHDSVGNLPGSQADPRMPDTRIDPDAPISSARGNGGP